MDEEYRSLVSIKYNTIEVDLKIQKNKKYLIKFIFYSILNIPHVTKNHKLYLSVVSFLIFFVFLIIGFFVKSVGEARVDYPVLDISIIGIFIIFFYLWVMSFIHSKEWLYRDQKEAKDNHPNSHMNYTMKKKQNKMIFESFLVIEVLLFNILCLSFFIDMMIGIVFSIAYLINIVVMSLFIYRLYLRN